MDEDETDGSSKKRKGRKEEEEEGGEGEEGEGETPCQGEGKASSSSKKAKVEKVVTKDEIRAILTKTMRPLRTEVAMVLAWPAIQWVQVDSFGDTLLGGDRGSIAGSKGVDLTVACLLLGDLKRNISTSFAPEPDGASNPFFAKKKSDAGGSTGKLASGRFSFRNGSSRSSSNLTGVDLLAVYLDHGVFRALHNLLGRLESTLVDDEDENSEPSQGAEIGEGIAGRACGSLDCISTLCPATNSSSLILGGGFLRIFHDLAGGPWNQLLCPERLAFQS